MSDLGSSRHWEKVSLSPIDILAIQLETELDKQKKCQQNNNETKRGIDFDVNKKKAAGKIKIQVLKATAIKPTVVTSSSQNDVEFHPYVNIALVPSSKSDATVKSVKSAIATQIQASAIAKNCFDCQWGEQELHELQHINSKKKLSLHVVLKEKSDLMADGFLGQVNIPIDDQFLDQQSHLINAQLYSIDMAQKMGTLALNIAFEFAEIERIEQRIRQLEEEIKEKKEYFQLFHKTAKEIKVDRRHPASFGEKAAYAALYVPGNKFKAEVHNPAAVSRTPLPEDSRVVTPYGTGRVIAFRTRTKTYVILLDSSDHNTKKHTSMAYLQEEIVREEPEDIGVKLYSKVTTPYGNGEVVEMHESGSLVVKLNYGTAYMNRHDVHLKPKELVDMTVKDKIRQASDLTVAGNDCFKAQKHFNAVEKYLQALGFIQVIKQDEITRKQKAIIIQTMIRCHLNLAACKLKLKQYSEAEIAATNAVFVLNTLSANQTSEVAKWIGNMGTSEDTLFRDWPCKAHYRRGQSFAKQQKLSKAKEDLVVALKLSNNKDKSIRQLYDRVSKQLAAEKKKEKKTWGGMFEKDETKAVQSSVTSHEDTVEEAQQDETEYSIDKVNDDAWWKPLGMVALATVAVAAVTLIASQKRKS